MADNLLSEKEIKGILKEAKDDRYSDKKTTFLTLDKTDIFKLSRESGLILIQGDKSTGLEHIMQRHSKSSNKAYWKKGNKLENQSKFRIKLALFQYLTVASKIYKPENKNNHEK